MLEYKIVIAALLHEKDLNELGKERWDHYQTTGSVHYFKRNVIADPKTTVRPSSGTGSDVLKVKEETSKNKPAQAKKK